MTLTCEMRRDRWTEVYMLVNIQQSNRDGVIGVMVVADDVDCGMVVLLRLLAMVGFAIEGVEGRSRR